MTYTLDPRTILVKPGPTSPAWAQRPYHKIEGQWYQESRTNIRGFKSSESAVIHMITDRGFKEVLPVATKIKAQKGKTYKAKLKGVPDAQFEMHMRFVSRDGYAADVTINPDGSAEQLGGVVLDHYELLEEIKPPVELPTGQGAVVMQKDLSPSYVTYVLNKGQWWKLDNSAAYSTSYKVPEEDVQRVLDKGIFKVFYEGAKKDPWEF